MKADFVTDLRPRLRALASALSAVLLGACAGPDVVPREVPPPPVTSVAQADQQLAAVALERKAIEARFAERERVCYDKFFVNNCLDEAKERRRSALAAQRAIEVQADRFKRQAVVEERDRNLAEAERRFKEQEARLEAEPPKPAPEPVPLPPPRKPMAPRLRPQQQQEAVSADKRAQNVRDYEARKAQSEERQRKVAQRKAEKAAKAAKEAADAKK
jgi:hypothetical protein